jgi:ribosomal-protein-alanine N-acetyltransferase
MDPGPRLATALAAVHAAAFAGEGRGWSSLEILALLTEPAISVRVAGGTPAEADGALAPAGFALYRAVADEAELLTLAVAPERRRRGLGAGLLAACEAGARAAGATRMFLEVAAGNAAARALYDRAGFRQCGRRPGYYRRPDGGRDDAVVMEKAL